MITTIDEYKQRIRHYPIETIEEILKNSEEKIDFLSSIIETGRENCCFSREFRIAAANERQDLCRLTSACHSILRGD